MRHILIEHARRRLAKKRGENAEHINVDEAIFLSIDQSEELVMLDEALKKLAAIDELKAKIVELHHFGGFTHEEIADLLDMSPQKVQRYWRFARSWLKREISGED